MAFSSAEVDDDRAKIVVVAGPTGVGKTAAGVALAGRFHGEVVNADSRYLYRGMDIGVAKPTIDERRGVPHHLIDIAEPDQPMSVAVYQAVAMAAIAGVVGRGRVPFLVGGTPLYLNAVVEGWRIPRVPPDPVLRARLDAEIERDGLPALVARLAAVDPVVAARSGTNARRVVRALEVFEATGVPMSSQEGKGPPPFRALELGLSMPRDRLYAAIGARVDHQLAHGLIDEVQRLLERGLAPDAPAMSALGYRQLLPYLRGDATLAEAAARIKTDTHRYVRHQETWLRRNPRLVRLDVTDPIWLDHAVTLVATFLTDNDDRTA